MSSLDPLNRSRSVAYVTLVFSELVYAYELVDESQSQEAVFTQRVS